MTIAEELLAAQAARYAEVDPLLPAPALLPAGDVISAETGGGRVAGVLVHNYYGRGTLGSLWSARDSWELIPLVGAAGGAGITALLAAWRDRMRKLDPPPPADSNCLVTWPSRDADATRAFLDHGLTALTVIGVRARRNAGGEPASDADRAGEGIRIRQARRADLDTALTLAMAEVRYSALVGGTVVREDATALNRIVLDDSLMRREPMWLAERDGVLVGLAQAKITESAPGTWAASRLPDGRWGYVRCVSVSPEARGTGVGQRMMSVVHRELGRAGVRGTYLHYNPPNPLSSVFWPRQGYRPLWTQWELRPATALR